MEGVRKKLSESWSYVCDETAENQRLDQYLTNITDLTRSQIKKKISEADILVNNQSVKAGYRLKSTDNITVTLFEKAEIKLIPQDLNLEVVYEAEDFAVINKPADMVVYPSTGNPDLTLANGLLKQFSKLSTFGGKLRPGIVHRLDKDTTGLIVIAKTNEFHRYFASQLQKHRVERHYLALIHGVMADQLGIIDAPISRHPKDRTKMAIVAEGRQAITHFKVKEVINRRYSLVECQLQTGRTHQIRVHFSGINHPIVGDPVYGRPGNPLGCTRQMLHAFRISFIHPHLGKQDFSIEPPKDFDIAIQKAKKSLTS